VGQRCRGRILFGRSTGGSPLHCCHTSVRAQGPLLAGSGPSQQSVEQTDPFELGSATRTPFPVVQVQQQPLGPHPNGRVAPHLGNHSFHGYGRWKGDAPASEAELERSTVLSIAGESAGTAEGARDSGRDVFGADQGRIGAGAQLGLGVGPVVSDGRAASTIAFLPLLEPNNRSQIE